MQKEFDDYEDYENPPFRWMSVLVLLLAVAGFFSLAWYAYYSGTSNVEYEDTIVLEANNAPVKVAPEDAGGMEFPHQEKTIYEALEEYDEESGEAKIVEDLEEPIIPADMPEKTQPSPESKVAAIIQKAVEYTQEEATVEKVEAVAEEKPQEVALVKPAAEQAKPVPAAKAANKVVAKPKTAKPAVPQVVVKVEKISQVTPSEEPKEAPKEKAEPVELMPKSAVKKDEQGVPLQLGEIPNTPPRETAPKPEETSTDKMTIKKPVPMVDKKKKAAPAAAPSTGSHMLQLGAYRSEEEAKKNWARISGAHATFLRGKTNVIVRADLGAKGVFYRLRAAGFSSKDDAVNTCTKLKARKQACYYTK